MTNPIHRPSNPRYRNTSLGRVSRIGRFAPIRRNWFERRDALDMVGRRFSQTADRRGRSRVGAFEPASPPSLPPLPALIIFHYCEPPRPAIVPWPGSPPLPQRHSRARSLADRASLRALLSTPRSGRDSPRFSICCHPSLRWMDSISRNTAENDNRSLSSTVFKGEVGS